MGVDYNSKVFIGSIVEAEYEKLPKKVLEEFEDDSEIYEGSFLGLHHYVNYNDEFAGFGFEIGDSEFSPEEIVFKEIDKLKEKLIKIGVKNPKIYHFVYQW